MASFTSANLKIKRAHSQAEELERQMRDVFGPGNMEHVFGPGPGEGEAYAFITERQANPREWRTVFRLLAEPSETWGVLLGEIVHNLRSALDHLVYEASAPDENGRPLSGTEFPIFIDEDKFRSEARGGGLYKIRGLTAETRAFVESVQPFRSKNPRRHSLWALQDLSNTDKHRLLNMVVAAYRLDGPLSIEFTPSQGIKLTESDTNAQIEIGISSGVLEDGAECLSFNTLSIFPDDTEVNVSLNVGFEVQMRDASPSVQGIHLPRLLSAIGKTSGNMMNMFKQLNPA